MWNGIASKRVLAASIAMIVMAAGCAKPPATPVAVIEDKVYTVTPDTLRVNAGILTAEVTGLKVTERIEAGSGTVVSPAKLTGKLVVKNGSNDQTVRLLGANVLYIDQVGQRITIGEKRIEPTLKFAGYGNAERLDPGQDTTQTMDVDFPADALKLKGLKEIRLDLTYIPSAFKAETLIFGVMIGAPAGTPVAAKSDPK